MFKLARLSHVIQYEEALELLRHDGYLVNYARHLNREMAVAAIKQCGLAIQFLAVIDFELALIACRQNFAATIFIKWIDQNVHAQIENYYCGQVNNLCGCGCSSLNDCIYVARQIIQTASCEQNKLAGSIPELYNYCVAFPN
jgi:hypothetical protein